jgi:hypothetical protein
LLIFDCRLKMNEPGAGQVSIENQESINQQ